MGRSELSLNLAEPLEAIRKKLNFRLRTALDEIVGFLFFPLDETDYLLYILVRLQVIINDFDIEARRPQYLTLTKRQTWRTDLQALINALSDLSQTKQKPPSIMRHPWPSSLPEHSLLNLIAIGSNQSKLMITSQDEIKWLKGWLVLMLAGGKDSKVAASDVYSLCHALLIELRGEKIPQGTRQTRSKGRVTGKTPKKSRQRVKRKTGAKRAKTEKLNAKIRRTSESKRPDREDHDVLKLADGDALIDKVVEAWSQLDGEQTLLDLAEICQEVFDNSSTKDLTKKSRSGITRWLSAYRLMAVQRLAYSKENLHPYELGHVVDAIVRADQADSQQGFAAYVALYIPIHSILSDDIPIFTAENVREYRCEGIDTNGYFHWRIPRPVHAIEPDEGVGDRLRPVEYWLCLKLPEPWPRLLAEAIQKVKDEPGYSRAPICKLVPWGKKTPKQSLREFIEAYQLPTRRLTSGRINRALSHVIYQLTQDDAIDYFLTGRDNDYADAPAYYSLFKRNTLHKIYAKAVDRIGSKSVSRKDQSMDWLKTDGYCGSQLVLEDGVLEAQIQHLRDAFPIREDYSQDQAALIDGLYISGLITLLSEMAQTGARPVNDPLYDPDAIDEEIGLIQIDDKRVGPAQRSRIVSFPQDAIDRANHYHAVTEGVSRQIDKYGRWIKTISEPIEEYIKRKYSKKD